MNSTTTFQTSDFLEVLEHQPSVSRKFRRSREYQDFERTACSNDTISRASLKNMIDKIPDGKAKKIIVLSSKRAFTILENPGRYEESEDKIADQRWLSEILQSDPDNTKEQLRIAILTAANSEKQNTFGELDAIHFQGRTLSGVQIKEAIKGITPLSGIVLDNDILAASQYECFLMDPDAPDDEQVAFYEGYFRTKWDSIKRRGDVMTRLQEAQGDDKLSMVDVRNWFSVHNLVDVVFFLQTYYGDISKEKLFSDMLPDWKQTDCRMGTRRKDARIKYLYEM